MRGERNPCPDGRLTGRRYRAGMEFRVVRPTSRFDEARHFWHDVLGWPVTREWPAEHGGGRGCIVGYGDVGRIEFLEDADAPAASGVFLSIEHPAVDALHDQVIAADAQVVHAPTDQPWGHRSIRFIDPSGLEVAIFQWI